MKSETSIKKPAMLIVLRQIAEEAKASKMSNEHLKNINTHLVSLSNYLKTSKTQAYLFSVMFSLSFNQKNLDLEAISNYIECNPIKLLELKNDFDFLVNNGFLNSKYKFESSNLPLANYSFSISRQLSEVIVNNNPISKSYNEPKPDIFSLIENIYDLGFERSIEDYPTFILSKNVESIINNSNLQLIKKLKQLRLPTEELFLFCYLCWKFLEGGKLETIEEIANIYFDNVKQKIEFFKKIASKESKLFTNNLIEAVENNFANNTELILSEKATELLLGKDTQLFIKKEKVKNLTKVTDIQKKELFYNNDEVEVINRLSVSLSSNNFNLLQKRLTKKNLPIGLTVLLEGSPGTGKTETVFQLAKANGRDVLHVDISQSKSMWFGESEKIVKKIFTNYEMLCKRSKVIPILLFNEADAILTKRIEGPDAGTSQTENTIQNIILEEMEKFKGIMIATTNLANNFDTAFERRFLYKIHFNQPDITTKAKIWKSKLPSLSIKDCTKLAIDYNFSGGQIDNVIRKTVMSEVVNNIKPKINEIIAMCKEEIPASKRTKLGF